MRTSPGAASEPAAKPARWPRGKWLRWLGITLSAIAFIYLLRVLIFGDVISGLLRLSFDPGQIALVMLVYLIALVLQYLVWARFAAVYRKTDWNDIDIFSRTVFMRRLPGGFWHWLGRTALYAHDGKLQEQQAIHANLIEWAMQLLTGMELLLLTSQTFPGGLRIFLFVLLLCVGYGLMREWHPKSDSTLTILRNLAAVLLIYTVIWGLSLAIFVMILGMNPSDHVVFSDATRIWLISGLTGVLTIPIPATFGVNEAILTMLLGNVISPDVALPLALLLRGIYILSDFAWGQLGWIVSWLMLRRKAP